ncbi:acyltransferase family protein [Galbitalea sp. SE-J8]|uniref:acyltransferase family protein n=1 Tax=Galbitalea sp. SE-J8 TaxID=3054952 RepID=UPI00259CCF90|nr:acyltransferase family protein [Galbitalea sp. SE-J8]MDM4761464.1 acyltransferase family protein [Galbitalea sp. SE-J8]
MTITAEIPRPVAATTPPATGRTRIPGLDGIRALAVIAVLVFHLLPGALDGGYIGVDVFFVLSGFLITGLLLRERDRSGGIRLRRFWQRRARRLLPALTAAVLACSAAAFLVGGDVLVDLWRQVLGAATFSYNWLDVLRGGDYFDDASPELFRNLWSLAVEEQFYALWPIAVLGLCLVRSRRLRVGLSLGVAAASAGAMLLLSLLGADGSRVYYGSDTHAFGLALGAAAAFALDARPAGGWGARLRRGVAIAGGVALLALVLLARMLPTDGPVVYRGGLVGVAVLATAFVVSVAVPGAPLGRVLDLAPLRWIGERSYGIYVWHWPVLVLALAWVPAFDFDPQGRIVLAVGVTLIAVAAAAISYRWLEVPIRERGLRATASAWADAARGSRGGRGAAITASVVVFALATMACLGLLTAPARTSTEAAIAAGQAAIATHGSDSRDGGAPAPGALAPGQAATDEATAAPLQAASGPITGDQITAIGDSVMLAVAPTLEAGLPGISIHASVARQAAKGPTIAEKLRARGELRSVLLIGLGTNGVVRAADLDAMIAAAGPGARAVLVNTQAPRSWVKGVNATLRKYAAARPGVVVADWHGAIHGKLSYLGPDRIHPGGPRGGTVYLRAVRAALTELEAGG